MCWKIHHVCQYCRSRLFSAHRIRECPQAALHFSLAKSANYSFIEEEEIELDLPCFKCLQEVGKATEENKATSKKVKLVD
jgi:hypothetical protein